MVLIVANIVPMSNQNWYYKYYIKI